MTAGRTDAGKDAPAASAVDPGKNAPFFLIAVGASGRQPDALIRLLASAPPGFGHSFVIATSDNGPDAAKLPDTLGARCNLPVLPIETGMMVESGRVFVCPRGKAVRVMTDTAGAGGRPDFRFEIRDGKQKPDPNSPLDTLLSSVAATFGEFAVGILLSGIGTDGSLGLREIKRRDGFVMLEEDSGTAEFTPKTWMLSGLDDRIGRPEKMVDALAQVIALRGTFVDEASVLLHPYRESFETLLQFVTGTSRSTSCGSSGPPSSGASCVAWRCASARPCPITSPTSLAAGKRSPYSRTSSLSASPASSATPMHGRRWRRSSCRSFSGTVPAAGAR
ncbi:MAG: chemotaxis protein CheB [Sagittula sp.]|uniref:chemotaxis protein CheB n=1 Tax=Sagittula sp. TaxID=2038081 RepID=UPI004059ECC3